MKVNWKAVGVLAALAVGTLLFMRRANAGETAGGAEAPGWAGVSSGGGSSSNPFAGILSALTAPLTGGSTTSLPSTVAASAPAPSQAVSAPAVAGAAASGPPGTPGTYSPTPVGGLTYWDQVMQAGGGGAD